MIKNSSVFLEVLEKSHSQIFHFSLLENKEIADQILTIIKTIFLKINHHGAEISVIWLVERNAIKRY